MDSCNIETSPEAESFEELYEGMQDDKYWIRFFCRPCCPAPDLEGAITMLDLLSIQVDGDARFADDEKAKIKELIEQRKEWYPKSGICRR